MLEQVSSKLLKIIREEEFTLPNMKTNFDMEKKKSKEQEINNHIIVDPVNNTVTGVYQYYEDKLQLLETNEGGAKGRATKVI